MSYFMVDVEADGPIPGDYSMVSFAAVLVETGLARSFYAEVQPISERWVPRALGVTGLTRERTLGFGDPRETMLRFAAWIRAHNHGRAMFISDNPGFDWQFINWYFHHFIGENPFGFSAMHLGSLYKGMVGDVFRNHKHLRTTPYTHHPLDDAKGNAEALLRMKHEMGLKMPLD